MVGGTSNDWAGTFVLKKAAKNMVSKDYSGKAGDHDDEDRGDDYVVCSCHEAVHRLRAVQ